MGNVKVNEKNNQLISYLQNNFSIKNVQSIKLLEHNQINSINYFIKSKRENYVLRNYRDNSSSEKIEKMCKILHNCSKNNLRVIKPILKNNGVYVDSKKKLYLTKFYKGITYNGNNTQLKDLAKNMAIMHKILLKNKIVYNYQIDHKFYKILNPNELVTIKRKINQKKCLTSFDNKILNNILVINESIKTELKNRKILNSYKEKKQLIHYDLHPKNVIFKNNKVAAILDFTSMRHGLRFEDISFTSFRFAIHNENNIEKIMKKINLFLHIYQKYNYIDKEQLNQYGLFVTKKILSRISYILRKNYFFNSDIWNIDLQKNITILKLNNKMMKSMNNVFHKSP